MSSTTIKKCKEIEISILLNHFYIDKNILRWKKPLSTKLKPGDAAGCKIRSGHIDLRFNGVRYYAHRIVFAMHYGRWPKSIIDHIDGDPSNNNPLNLREATDSQNNYNCSKRKTNTTGVKNLYKHTDGWQAEISADKQRFRKWFKNKEDALNWVKNMRQQKHGKFANHD